MQRILAGLLLAGLLLPAGALANEQDPWESFNRRVFAFNEFLDGNLLKPVARAYHKVTPEPVDRSITHFFNNLDEVGNALNFALQGEGSHAVDSASRLVANTLLGVGGLFDVAAAGGIPRRDSGFGTTLGKWGVGKGPYLVLPFWGPGTVRDALAIPADRTVHPLDKPVAIDMHDRVSIPLSLLEVVDIRADVLRYEQLIVGDRYTFLRDAYLQRRHYEVHGEQPAAPDPFLDEDFDEGEPTSGDTGETGE